MWWRGQASCNWFLVRRTPTTKVQKEVQTKTQFQPPFLAVRCDANVEGSKKEKRKPWKRVTVYPSLQMTPSDPFFQLISKPYETTLSVTQLIPSLLFNVFNITHIMSAIPWCQNIYENMTIYLLLYWPPVTFHRHWYSQPVCPDHVPFYPHCQFYSCLWVSLLSYWENAMDLNNAN